MRWIFFHSLIHGWSWEQLDGDARVVAESHSPFDTREEAERDAALNGYDGDGELDEDRFATRVLLVQSDDDARRDVVRALGHMQVIATGSCDHALELSTRNPFDCYVVDCGVKSGALERFCTRLRAVDPRVPVILYTAEQGMDGGADALIAGANLALRKPDDLDPLRYTIDAMVNMARERAREARLAELAAVKDELFERSAELQQRVSAYLAEQQQKSAAVRDMLEQDRMRLLACKAFLGRGGTRAEFERAWPGVAAAATASGVRGIADAC